MTEPDALQQATERLDAAVDELEGFLQHILAEGKGGESVASLKGKVRSLTEERDRLRIRSRCRRSRARRLKAANDEVSGRLEAVMVTLKDMMPAVPG